MAAAAVRSMVAQHTVQYDGFVDDNISVSRPPSRLEPLSESCTCRYRGATVCVRATVSYR